MIITPGSSVGRVAERAQTDGRGRDVARPVRRDRLCERPGQLQPEWRQPHRNSVMLLASLQCSEQYLPNSPFAGTVQEQPGWAHC